ncbi:ABC-2 type transporter family protein [Clostridium argentinense CDC 2741]|uniref:ABC-2 type transporter family protein n=1 Tax=Clostridium argentinense CDC 2741 TaxID=1418104 RepID=A0A0C1U8N2_9CLOT|nr:ABC transporter permease [Clostridium argentinense]ARC85167.1 hypothetical protein RSJ17_12005 [Clostridium argentinense]KIE48068.1 ABC-2 type transporter family protein [Clostridium argentinense CDC 2741]
MRFISIVVKEIKQHLRDKSYMILMILFPIFLTAILVGSAGSDWGEEIVFNSRPLVYYVEGEGEGESSEAFKTMIKGLKNVDKKEIYSSETGIEEIKNNKSSAYINFKANENKITIYKNENHDIEGSLIELHLNSFVERFNILMEIDKVRRENLSNIMDNDKNHNYVKIESLDKLKRPASKDYSGIMTILTMVMYCSTGGISIVNVERYRKTLDRLIIAPVNRVYIFLALTIGAFIVNCIQFTIVISVLKYLFHINFGEDFISVILIVVSLAILAISIGCSMSLMIPKEKSYAILNILLVFTCFLGGSYIPIENLNSEFLMKLTNLSPIRWAKNAIFSVIYANDYSKFYSTLALNFGIAAVLFLISMRLFKRMEE